LKLQSNGGDKVGDEMAMVMATTHSDSDTNQRHREGNSHDNSSKQASGWQYRVQGNKGHGAVVMMVMYLKMGNGSSSSTIFTTFLTSRALP